MTASIENINQKSQQLEQHMNEIKGLRAQLEAHKQMVNEGLAVGVQLRTNLVLFQQALQEANTEKENFKKQVDVLNLKLADAKASQADTVQSAPVDPA